MKRTVAAAVAGVALAGAVGAGVAMAATGNGPGSMVSDVLSGLVRNGTISQSQADAVEKALTDAREQAQADRQQARDDRQAEVDALLEDTVGLTRQEIRDQIAAGKTLREIAGDKADELVAGLAKILREDLDQAVADGRITQEQADAMAARAQERADAWVNGDDAVGHGFGLEGLLGRGFGMGRHGGGPGMMGDRFGPGPQGWMDDGDDDGSTGSTSTTSA
jgi:polyhydroxyalkanoate synthesis regulator phasin